MVLATVSGNEYGNNRQSAQCIVQTDGIRLIQDVRGKDITAHNRTTAIKVALFFRPGSFPSGMMH